VAEIGSLDPVDANNIARWPEGMQFRQVNNSARADEGLLARWFRDTNGSISSSGSPNAYALTSGRTISSLVNNTMMAFTANFTNTGAAALNLNGLGAKSLLRPNGNPLIASDIVSGQTCLVIYKSATDQWFLINAPGSPTGADLDAIEALTGVGVARRTGTNTWALDDGTTAITFEKDNAGLVLPTGALGDAQVPFACTITGVTLLADQSGSCVVDIWKRDYASYPPTVGQTITAAAKPTISATTKYTDATLTGWTTAVAAGDTLRFNLDSVSTITRLTIILKVKRFI
jgi:hypothetical protein